MDFNDFWQKYSWHNWPSNGSSSSHLTQCLFLHYLRKIEQTKYALECTTNVNKLDIRSHKNLITVVWANEVHRLLTYCSTSCYQTRRWWHVRVSAVPRTSASAREAIKLLERGTPDFISPDLWPPNSSDLNLVNCKLWGSCNSGSIRRRSRMRINSRSNRLKSGLVWSRTLLTLLSTNGENVCVLVFARRPDISDTYCRQLNNWIIGSLFIETQCILLQIRLLEHCLKLWHKKPKNITTISV